MSKPGTPATAEDRLLRLTAIGLATGRIAIGAGLWLAPQRSAKALGFGSLDQTALALGRIAATRDLALGAWQLTALEHPDRLRRVTTSVAAVDAGDALAFALALRAGGDVRGAGIRGLPGAAVAAIAGAWLAGRLSRRSLYSSASM